VLLATRELTGGVGALSQPRSEARKVALLMTDGQATLPDPVSRQKCANLAIEAAQRAGELGIRIDTFAVGPGAANKPRVTLEMASATNGVFTAVLQPGDLVAAFQDLRLADITGIQISNLTTRHPAEQVRLDPDGWFAGIVGLTRGRNRIEIRAYASDGRRIIRVVDIDLPQPRNEQTRESDRYFELVTEVREALRGRHVPASGSRTRVEGPVG